MTVRSLAIGALTNRLFEASFTSTLKITITPLSLVTALLTFYDRKKVTVIILFHPPQKKQK